MNLHNKTFKKAIRIFTLLVLVIAIIGCSSEGTSSNNNKKEKSEDGNNEMVITMSTYPVGAIAYTQSAALADAFQKAGNGIKVRNIPVDAEIGRYTGLKEGTSDIALFGASSAYFLSHGLLDYAAPDIGPQRVRQVWNGGTMGQNLITTQDSGIKEVKDLKGKRIPDVAGSPGVNLAFEASLAFAGLTFDDVELVKYPGLSASWDGLAQGQIDVSYGGTTVADFLELESSPKGIHWIPFPEEDTEGWERKQALTPFYQPVAETLGAGLSEEEPGHISGSVYPYLLTMEDNDEDTTYQLAKEIHNTFDLYKDVHPLFPRWELEEALTIENMLIPFHDGVVKYLKEINFWTDEHEKKQISLIEDQDKLVKLWKEMKEEGIEDKDEYMKKWIEKHEQNMK